MANVKKIDFNKSVDILTENLKEYPLSNYDLKQIIPDIKITTSLDLKNIRFADELVNSQGIGILLWQYKELEGHWVGLIKHPNNNFEIFDSYNFPFKQINQKLKSNLGVSPNVLTNLIQKSGYKPVFNTKRLQSLSKNDNSCGRYVILRLCFYQYDIKTFHKILNEIQTKYKINPLELSVLTTFKEIGT